MISTSKTTNKYIKNYNKLEVHSRAAIWFTLCNFGVRILNFISAPILARLLTSDQYGIVSVFNAYQQIVIILATLELYYGAYNKGYLKFNDCLGEFTFSLILLSNVITIGMFLLSIPAKTIFVRHIHLGANVLLLVFLMILVQPAFYCWVAKLRYEYKYQKVVLASITFSTFSVFVPIIIIRFINASAEAKVFSTLLVSILFYIPFYISLICQNIKTVKIKHVTKFWRFALSFQMPLMIHSLSFLILGQSDRIMISEMVDASTAGIYSVSYTIGSLATVLQTSINQAYQPFRYSCLKQKDYKKFSKSTNNIMFVFGLTIIAFSLVAPEIIKLLFSEEYQQAMYIIPAIVASSFFMLLYSIFVDIETYFEKTKYVMYASCSCAVLNIVLNYFAISRFDYRVCGLTTLVSYIAFAIMHYILMQRTCKSKKIDKNLIDIKRVIGTSAMILVIECVTTLLYDNVIIRYLMIIVAIVIAVKNRNVVRKIVTRE